MEKPWRESSAWLWEGTLAEGGNGTHREKERIPQDGIPGYLQLPAPVVQEGLVAAGCPSGSSSQGDLTGCVSGGTPGTSIP